MGYTPYAQPHATSTTIVYNNSGATIPKGYAVGYSTTVTQVEAPHLETAVKQAVVGSQKTNDEANFIGIALEDIANGEYGLVCTKGRCEAYIESGVSVSAGSRLTPTTTENKDGEFTTTASWSEAVAIALGAASSSTSLAPAVVL